jgi:hypothetical protein
MLTRTASWFIVNYIDFVSSPMLFSLHLSPRMTKSAAVVESTVLAFSYSIDNNDDVLGICNATAIP